MHNKKAQNVLYSRKKTVDIEENWRFHSEILCLFFLKINDLRNLFIFLQRTKAVSLFFFNFADILNSYGDIYLET